MGSLLSSQTIDQPYDASSGLLSQLEGAWGESAVLWGPGDLRSIEVYHNLAWSGTETQTPAVQVITPIPRDNYNLSYTISALGRILSDLTANSRLFIVCRSFFLTL